MQTRSQTRKKLAEIATRDVVNKEQISDHSPERSQELELKQVIVAVQEQTQEKSGECNSEEYEKAINDAFEDDRDHSPERSQELELKQIIVAVQEQTQEKLGECNSEEYDKVINDACEDDEDSSENEAELESLLKKAEESLRKNQSTNNKIEHKIQNEFSFPSLDVGVSVDEQLYIKKHPGGIAILQQNEIILQDSLSQRYKTPVPSLSKTSSTTVDGYQDSSAKLSKKEKQKIRESTTGPGWFDMKKPEITPEIKRDLQIIKLRNVLDPKRFYKKDDSKGIPKYFEIGTIKEGPTEFFSSRIPRKERKQTIADELLADEQSKNYFKRKFSEIQEVKQSGGKKYYKQLKSKRKPKWKKGF